jgi:uncharacterized membrane protein (UPF0127 family)
MRKKIIFAAAILILVFAGKVLAQDAGHLRESGSKVCFAGSCFSVALAENREEQLRGLMFVESMPSDQGMLFIYGEEAPRSFYMKNTRIPLDIIWIDKDKRVVFIKKNAEPAKGEAYETVLPDEKAMYVLELNAGSADRIGLKNGDKLQF